MYDRIVIPVDGSEEATRAAQRGLELAAAFDAELAVLHVVEGKAVRLTRRGDERERLRARGTEILEAIQDLASEDHPITTTLAEGKPAAEISRFAADQDADLIVIGRQGLTGPRRRLLGGVTEQVLHRSEVPILVVPGEAPTETNRKYDRICIPTDGSDTAESATDHGVAIAQQYDAAIHALNVVDLQAAGGLFSAGGLKQTFIDRLETEGEAAVESLQARIEAAGPDQEVVTAVRRTTSVRGAAKGIEAYVADNDIDLIVMGSHGQSNLKTQLLGSVAATVLRTVETPVVVVKR